MANKLKTALCSMKHAIPEESKRPLRAGHLRCIILRVGGVLLILGSIVGFVSDVQGESLGVIGYAVGLAAGAHLLILARKR